jgi:hypothetical protein
LAKSILNGVGGQRYDFACCQPVLKKRRDRRYEMLNEACFDGRCADSAQVRSVSSSRLNALRELASKSIPTICSVEFTLSHDPPASPGSLQRHAAPSSMLLAPCYLMIFVARANTSGGIVRPICLAAFKLMISSNFMGCSTGRSAGFVPFKILSTYVAERRVKSRTLAE